MNLLEELRVARSARPGRWPLAVRGCCVRVVFALGVTVALIVLASSGASRPARAAAAPRTRSRRCAASSRTSTPRRVNLDVYKQQLEDIERSFGALLRQLPGKTEVPNLLVDISQTGLAAGLQEKLFQPGPEESKDFYAELPIKIRLTGSYHQFGEFVSGIAALPRIVTLHDIEITPVDGKSRGYDQLSIDAHRQDLPLPRRGRDRRGEADARKKKTGRRDVTTRIAGSHA